MTLAAFGFIKKVMLCDIELEFDIPKTAYALLLHAEFTNCMWKLKNAQGVGVHKLNSEKDTLEIFP